MQTLSPWDELLNSVGETVEDAAEMLKDRKWSIEELRHLSNSLKNCITVLDHRIAFLDRDK